MTNATDGAGVPSQSGASVTVQTTSATVSDTGHFYDVNFVDGDDTLIGVNMPWPNPASGDTLGFDHINMGSGQDFASLSRSGFYSTLDMGGGDDRLILDNSGGRDVLLGDGNDFTRLDMSGADRASEEELAQKVGHAPMDLDGGTGNDTLNLVGDWTLTLSAGNFTLDTDGNGFGDTTTSILRSDQYDQVVGMPALLAGTVRWGDTITLSGGDTVLAQATFANFEDLNAVCFTAGTPIATPAGPVAVETLAEGDLVVTRAGVRPIRWIGRRRLDLVDLMANPKILPIRVAAGAFAPGRPARALRFSPQHRLVVRSAIAQAMFGAPEVLVAARHLLGLDGIEVDGETRTVTYVQMLLDEHAVLAVEGIEAETLFPGPQALRALPADARAEVETLLPGSGDAPVRPALPLLKGRDARALAARHRQAGEPLWS
ncbi:Hint domain-containing protein [Phaeovulum vinaykumarii]|uniref:Hint domain-containing protein n=1 Tax=Phaeovulum vinaykumarii TaxID=407234 RepID=UPI00117BDED1|nr:Hint domain-containing protein [Phaeovulum vinaykumarii]